MPISVRLWTGGDYGCLLLAKHRLSPDLEPRVTAERGRVVLALGLFRVRNGDRYGGGRVSPRERPCRRSSESTCPNELLPSREAAEREGDDAPEVERPLM